jgi:hypothetical protein
LSGYAARIWRLGKTEKSHQSEKKRKDGISAEDVFPSFDFFFDTLPEKKT